MAIIPVILSGGAGTRLWPLSRELYPKQFHVLTGEQTMLQSTLTRLNSLPELASPLVVCNDQHRFLVAEQLRQINIAPAGIILEPVGRNTAPAVAVAALQAAMAHDDPLLLVLPADHVIGDAVALCQAITKGIAAAINHKLVTFGIVPHAPETGYGYIRATDGSDGVANVSCFVEKPDLATANAYMRSGEYLWNSGIFLFKASQYLRELKKSAPDIHDAADKAFRAATRDRDFIRIDPELFTACRSESIDYAVMEKTAAAVVVSLDAHWNDIGSWAALWQLGSKDSSGNVINGNIVALETRNCYLRAEHRLLSTVGVKDLVIVETSDAILVASRDQAQNVKILVEQLKRDCRPETALHRKVHRPWGTYEQISHEDRFQVKRITVRPGAALSLQVHKFRAEHWVVVSGTARITCGEKRFTLIENQSTYIPVGVLHRLENTGSVPLELIEVQSGSYLGEDDIVRYEDNYGRE